MKATINASHHSGLYLTISVPEGIPVSVWHSGSGETQIAVHRAARSHIAELHSALGAFLERTED